MQTNNGLNEPCIQRCNDITQLFQVCLTFLLAGVQYRYDLHRPPVLRHTCFKLDHSKSRWGLGMSFFLGLC